MPRKVSASGFTLVELMVSMVILAIISTIGLATYTNAQVSGRDGKRKQDVRSIATGVVLYDQRFGHYPCTGGVGGAQNSSGGGTWINDGCAPNGPMVPSYINQLPVDPTNSAPNVYHYASIGGGGCHLATDGGGFVISAVLENGGDPDAIHGGSVSLCNGGSITSGNWGPNAFVVASN